jgi:hypothetical protein
VQVRRWDSCKNHTEGTVRLNAGFGTAIGMRPIMCCALLFLCAFSQVPIFSSFRICLKTTLRNGIECYMKLTTRNPAIVRSSSLLYPAGGSTQMVAVYAANTQKGLSLFLVAVCPSQPVPEERNNIQIHNT